MSVFDELQWRGLVYDSSEGVVQHLQQGPVSHYIGFDPTAASLHVGSLLQIMGLARMQRFGHLPIALVGGGTGMIGDPSGKSKERQLLTAEKVGENLAGIESQLRRFLDFETKQNPAKLVDNGEWLNSAKLVEFLRDIGKHFTVNYMLAKESVKRRIEQEDGISYTEFTYLLLQSYDFLVLKERYGCTLQMGGSDQWGNITAGAELIRRMGRGKAFSLVSPLVMSSSGTKFGKTESGAVWLDAERTSPFRFYQYWLNTNDLDVETYLKYFTWLDREQIAGIVADHQAAPHRREAQKRLAAEVTEIVHGPTALERALTASRVLFGGDLGTLDAAEILDIFDDVPSTSVSKSTFVDHRLVDLTVECGLLKSKGAARRLIRDGGLYLNNHRITEHDRTLGTDDLLHGKLAVLRKGQKVYHLVQVTDSSPQDLPS